MRNSDTCRKPRVTLRCRPKPGSLDSHGEVVDAYIRDYRLSAQRERKFFKECGRFSQSRASAF